MSNNIYDIMKKLNAVEGIDKVPETQSKNTTLLEATIQEVLGEKYMGFKAVAASAKKGGAKDPEAVAASIGRKKYGKEKFQAAAAAGKKLGENAKLSERVPVGSNTDLDAADFPMPGNKLSPKDQYRAIMKDVDTVNNYTATDPHTGQIRPTVRNQGPSIAIKNLEKDSDKGRFAVPGLGDQGQFFQEDDMEEGNLFTGNLAKARAAGKKRADLDGDGDMETVKEQRYMAPGYDPDYRPPSGDFSNEYRNEYDEYQGLSSQSGYTSDEFNRLNFLKKKYGNVTPQSQQSERERIKSVQDKYRAQAQAQADRAEAELDRELGRRMQWNRSMQRNPDNMETVKEQGVTEGYILKKTRVEKTFTPGDPDEYYTSGGADVTTKDTDYEIINNKTGQVVGTASWTTNDYFGPGALKITMKNGATRWLDIWEREKGNPQTAFNRFVKDPKTAKKYKEQDVAEGSEQIYKVVALDKGNALKKPTKMKVKADSIEDLFSRLSANDWYPLEINGVEVVAGKRLKQGVMEEKKTTKTGTVHKAKPGRYGGYDPETDPDKDEDDKKSEPAVKRGRGRPKKNADSDTGEVKKWDTSALQSAFGSSAPKKLPGKASVKHKMKDDDKLDEVAPPGKKAERMVKNIKKGYAKDGKLTDKEKGIAYATTWKAHNKGKVEESIPPGFPKSLAKKIYEQCDGDMKNTLSTMWKVYNSVMESKKSSNKKISEGMKFEQSTTKPAMGTYKGGLWTADPPKKGEVGAPVPSPDEGAPVKQQSKRRPQKEDVSENKELNDVLKLAGMVDESVKVDECGMSPISGAYGDTMQDTEGRMSINTNMSTDGNKTVTITADGDSAVELMQMLKMAGLSADGGEDTDIEKMSEEKDDRYEANTTPEEEVLPVQSQLKGGDGEVAGKEKKMTPHGYKFADNPLAMNESMTLKLMKEYESIKKVK